MFLYYYLRSTDTNTTARCTKRRAPKLSLAQIPQRQSTTTTTTTTTPSKTMTNRRIFTSHKILPAVQLNVLLFFHIIFFVVSPFHFFIFSKQSFSSCVLCIKPFIIFISSFVNTSARARAPANALRMHTNANAIKTGEEEEEEQPKTSNRNKNIIH